jgi:AraC family transcriptional regulator, melibiose operon regulatory protein
MNKQSNVLDDPLYGWWIRCGEPVLMATAHRHNELELNLLQQGEIVYLFPGRRVELHAGQLFFFWSAVPHQLVEKSSDAYIHWMTIPLPWLFTRSMPDRLTQRLLGAIPLLEDVSSQEQIVDISALFRWQNYLETTDADKRTILALEVEARLRRLVLNSHVSQTGILRPLIGKVEQIAHYLVENYTEDWTVRDAAIAAGLHPNYAMALFRRTYGISMSGYVTQLRVALAQQLLVNSEMDVLQVGYESGFGSTSRYYAAFKEITGQTPFAFRRSLNWTAE